ncbi:MAG: hypothetical protein NTV01_16795 [Bacteroidia bacterium]|nr:hypothetical protein [Bacteroidia bacterium]
MKTSNMHQVRISLGCLTLLLVLALFLSGAPQAFAQTTTPARNAGTGTNVTGVGTVAWTNPENIVSNDNTYATVAVTGGAISNYLQATNFGFSIPPEATSSGITVTIGRFESGLGTGNDVRDSYVQLIKGGTVGGTNLAVTGTEWPTSEGVATYGGTGSTWALTWIPADINAANFGVALAVNSTNNRTGSVDYIEIAITLTIAGTYKSQFTAMNTGSPTWCPGETRTVTVTVKNNGTLTWTDSWPDINIGVKWNTNGTSWADYYVRTDAGNLAPGATATYSLTITASNATAGPVYGTPFSAGSNNLTFDAVYEGLSWFAGNGGGVGPGNTVYASPAITIGAVPAQPGTISGSATPCAGSSQTYSVTNVGGVTYAWTFPSGWSQTGGGTTNSVVVTVGAVSGNVQVTPSIASCTGTPRTLPVTVNALPATPTASDQTICKGSTATFTASGASGGDRYKWYDAASAGVLLKTSTNNTDNTFTTPALTNTTSYWVSIISSANCETSRTQVTANVSSPAASVTGKTNIACYAGTNGTITIQASGGVAPYQFSLDNGLTYTTGSNPNPYTFTGLSANIQNKIRVKDSNGCESPAIL